jgi:methyl-accepting chemotaxis protein
MKSLKITHTIYLLLGSALLAGGIAATYLMVRCSSVSASYTQIIGNEVTQAQQVRAIQLNFKKQVQAWKDILLRGRDDAALAKYNQEFHTRAADVQSAVQALSTKVDDPQAKQQLSDFGSQVAVLDQQYEAALADYRASRDFAAADAAVKGKDRAPTDTLDKVVDRLTGLAASVPAAVTTRLHREQTVMAFVLVFLWAALGLWSFVFARSLGVRLNASVHFVRRIAEGDLTAEAAVEGHGDELGELIAAMTHMRDQLARMVGEMQQITRSLTSDSSDVAHTSARISQTIEEQQKQSTQVAAALEQLIASAREVAGHCKEASHYADQTGGLAADSSRSVENVANDVRALASAVEHNAQAVVDLGEQTRQIGQVVNLIEEIAGQTNLLALNAAIESARAGEQGKGFAVVAGEVRRLAERTTAATKEIAGAVQQIQSGTEGVVNEIQGNAERVRQSVSAADAAAQSLTVLGTSAEEVRQRIAQIAHTSDEQSDATGLLGRSMNQIASGITASSESVEASVRTAKDLAGLAHELDEQSAQFRIEGGSGSHHRAA